MRREGAHAATHQSFTCFLRSQSDTRSPKPCTLNPTLSTLHPKPETPNLKRETGKVPRAGTFDYVVAADCLFFKDFHIDLVHTIKTLLSASGTCLLFAPLVSRPLASKP